MGCVGKAGNARSGCNPTLSKGYFGSQSEPVRVVQGTKVAMSRFMMHRPGAPRPLSFDPREKTGPVLASASTRWAGIPLEIHDVPSFDAPLDTSPMKGARGMILALDGVRTLFVRQGRSERQLMAKPGLIGFAEGGQSAGVVRSVGQSRVLVMDVPAIWQERLLLDGGPESFVELPVIPAHETAQALGLAMYSEVKSGASSGAMFAESLSIALLSYVAERIPARSMRVRGSLSDAQRRRLARYIDEHLQEDLKLTDIAKLVGLQPRHFSTLFRKAFGITPHQYLIERRIEHGARLLAGSAADIATIALHVGFSSQSHFATAFRKRYGMSPRRYAISRRSSFAGS